MPGTSAVEIWQHPGMAYTLLRLAGSKPAPAGSSKRGSSWGYRTPPAGWCSGSGPGVSRATAVSQLGGTASAISFDPAPRVSEEPSEGRRSLDASSVRLNAERHSDVHRNTFSFECHGSGGTRGAARPPTAATRRPGRAALRHRAGPRAFESLQAAMLHCDKMKDRCGGVERTLQGTWEPGRASTWPRTPRGTAGWPGGRGLRQAAGRALDKPSLPLGSGGSEAVVTLMGDQRLNPRAGSSPSPGRAGLLRGADGRARLQRARPRLLRRERLPEESDRLLAFLDRVPPGKLVIVATQGDVSEGMNGSLRAAFGRLGAKNMNGLAPKEAVAFVGQQDGPTLTEERFARVPYDASLVSFAVSGADYKPANGLYELTRESTPANSCTRTRDGRSCGTTTTGSGDLAPGHHRYWNATTAEPGAEYYSAAGTTGWKTRGRYASGPVPTIAEAQSGSANDAVVETELNAPCVYMKPRPRPWRTAGRAPGAPRCSATRPCRTAWPRSPGPPPTGRTQATPSGSSGPGTASPGSAR